MVVSWRTVRGMKSAIVGIQFAIWTDCGQDKIKWSMRIRVGCDGSGGGGQS